MHSLHEIMSPYDDERLRRNNMPHSIAGRREFGRIAPTGLFLACVLLEHAQGDVRRREARMVLLSPKEQKAKIARQEE